MVELKINKYTRKLIIIFLSFLTVIIIFWAYLYSIKMKEQLKAVKEIEDVDKSFVRLNDIIMKSGTISAGLKKLNKDYLKLKNHFPDRIQDVSKAVSDLAKEYKLVIVSIAPKLEGPLKNPEGGDFKIGSLTCSLAKLNIVATGSFLNMGNYFQALDSSFPYLVNIDSFAMRKSSAKAGSMQANIVISAYLLN